MLERLRRDPGWLGSSHSSTWTTPTNCGGPLRAVSDDWLAAKTSGEKGFSLGFFDEAYVSRFPIAVIEHHGRIQAFANIWPGPDREELSIDSHHGRCFCPGRGRLPAHLPKNDSRLSQLFWRLVWRLGLLRCAAFDIRSELGRELRNFFVRIPVLPVAVLARCVEPIANVEERLRVLYVDGPQGLHADGTKRLNPLLPGRPVLVDERLHLFGLQFNPRVLRFFAGPRDVAAGHHQQVSRFDEPDCPLAYVGPFLIGLRDFLARPTRTDGRRD